MKCEICNNPNENTESKGLIGEHKKYQKRLCHDCNHTYYIRVDGKSKTAFDYSEIAIARKLRQ